MRFLLIAAALALAPVSAWAQADDGGAPITRITAAQNGETVSVADGGKVVIQLQVNPSTGAHWELAGKPENVSDPETAVGAPTLAPGARPVLGAPRVATFTFAVTGSGSGEIVLERHGPGVANALLETFRVTIEAP